MILLGVLNSATPPPLNEDLTESIPTESITTRSFVQTTSDTGKAAFLVLFDSMLISVTVGV